MLYQYSDPALKALTRAGKFAEQQQTACIDSPHLFLGILEESNDDPIISNLLKVSGVSVEEARLYAESALEANPISPQKTSLSASAQLVLEYASNEALRDGKKVIEVEHLFIACIRSQRGPHVGAVLRPLGLDADKLRQHLRALSSKPAPYRLGSPLNTLTDSSNLSIEAAQKLTRSSFCGRISTAHLLLGLLETGENEATRTLRAAGVDIEELQTLTRAQIVSDGQIAGPQKKFTAASKRALERAREQAHQNGQTLIGPQHLLSALLPSPVSLQEKLHYGSGVNDPLEKVWSGLPVAKIQRQVNELGGRDSQSSSSALPLTEGSKKIFEMAHQEMAATSCHQMTKAHLLLGILSDWDSLAVTELQTLGCNIEELKQKARALISPDHRNANKKERLSRGCQWALEIANKEAKGQKFKFIDSGHLLLGLLNKESAKGKPGEDSIGHLWTEQQLTALRQILQPPQAVSERENPPHPRAKLVRTGLLSNSSLAANGSLILGICWGVRTSPLHSVPTYDVFTVCLGPALFLITSIGLLASLRLRWSPQVTDLWQKAWGGLFLGAVVGIIVPFHR